MFNNLKIKIMANECLVQALKGEVTQDLPILNTIRIDKTWVQSTFNTNYYCLITPVSGKTVVCSLSDNKVFLDGSGNPMGNVENVTYPNYLHLPLSGCRMYIKNKSNLKGFATTFTVNSISVSLDEFAYCPKLEIIEGQLIGNLGAIKSCIALKVIHILSSSNITGELADVAELTTLEDFECRQNIGGNIADLGDNIALKNITLVGNKFVGSLESFVVAQRNAGRTTVTSANALIITLSSTQIEFNGSNASTGQSTPLYWDATTITYNGITITA